MGLPAPGARRRPRASAPRDIIVKIRVTPAEHELITAAAQRSGLSAGAWIADACIAAASEHAEPAAEVDRQALAELIRLSGLARKAGNLLNQAVARLNATGQPGPDLAPAAAWVTRVAGDVDNASLALSERMTRRTRRKAVLDIPDPGDGGTRNGSSRTGPRMIRASPRDRPHDPCT